MQESSTLFGVHICITIGGRIFFSRERGKVQVVNEVDVPLQFLVLIQKNYPRPHPLPALHSFNNSAIGIVLLAYPRQSDKLLV